MAYVRIETDWKYCDCRVLRLESDETRLEIMPELGGKIYRWIDKQSDRDVLWQHPRLKPAVVAPGGCFDDRFFGGWDEQFPNDMPGCHQGESYPDHGEYWTTGFDWQVERTGDTLTLYLVAEGPVTPTRMERWITVTAGSRTTTLRYRLSHLGQQAFDYLWKLHPALNVGPGCRLIIPAERGRLARAGCGRFSETRVDFEWPDVPGKDGKLIDASVIPAGSEACGWEMFYLTRLRDGWWAILDGESRSGFGLAFDKTLFNTVWLFQTFGSWRGLNVAVVEPATGYPDTLAEASASGRLARLEPKQVVETQVTATLLAGRTAINGISRDGTVT
ncbi:MAG: DUF5107 domain-containing protein [Phycisphaerae bacterium]|nr:DUF5107 domain-containing protein [Phycisphaerae bacterium]